VGLVGSVSFTLTGEVLIGGAGVGSNVGLWDGGGSVPTGPTSSMSDISMSTSILTSIFSPPGPTTCF